MQVFADDGQWCLDSGATSHMCFHKEKFENIKSESLNLKLANDASAPVVGSGKVLLETSIVTAGLEETRYVPQLRSNLMSVSKISDHGFEVTFRRDGAVLSDPQTGKRIATASRKSNLYFINQCREKFKTVSTACKASDLQKWH